MIKDNIKNYKNYTNLDNNLKKWLIFLASCDFSEMSDGRHDIDDKNFINIQTYTTKKSADFEAHRDYIDVQYIIKGKERIGVQPYSVCVSKIPYDKEKDIEFLSGEDNFFDMNEGDFMILYPEDAHKPSIYLGQESEVRKAVLKIFKI